MIKFVKKAIIRNQKNEFTKNTLEYIKATRDPKYLIKKVNEPDRNYKIQNF